MRRVFIGSLALTAALSGCGDLPRPTVAPAPTTAPAATSTTTSTTAPAHHRDRKADTWNMALVLIAEAAAQTTTTTTAIEIGDAISVLPSDGDYHDWPDWPLWHAVGLCEQRGSGPYDSNGDGIAWHGSPAGGMPGSGYPGGLGLSRDFWRQFAPPGFPSNGADASPGQQIIVARVGSHNGTGMGGWSSWGSGCIQRTMNGG